MRKFSGIDLAGIQHNAGEIYDKYRLSDDKTACSALLIANLAARMQEKPKCDFTFQEDRTDEPESEMKTHQVTVQYRATIDMNDEIRDAILQAFHDGVLDYLQITSDRDGV